MFNILVAGDGLAWESEGTMTMDRTRFNEYSGVEGESVSGDRPESLAALEAADTLLMYETAATGPHVGVVRVGKLSNIRAGRRLMSFLFKETGRLPRSVVEEYATTLNLDRFEFSRTHWSIKDGTIPELVREKIEADQE